MERLPYDTVRADREREKREAEEREVARRNAEARDARKIAARVYYDFEDTGLDEVDAIVAALDEEEK